MDTEEEPKAKRQPSKKGLALMLTGLVVIAFAIGAVGAQLYGKPGIQVPKNLASKLSFPMYLPKRLPGNFKLVQSSFSDSEGALIFIAKDSTGATLSFAEQKRDPKFDFTNFYNNQLSDAKTLSNVPYPSVTGKAKTNSTRILSVVTDETWLFVSTAAPLGQEDMQFIAENLQLSR